MREILFRGKRKLGNEWIEGSLHTEKFTDDEEFLCCEVCRCDVYPETVGQFIGLIDVNGKKIFEGDYIVCRQAIEGNFVDEHIEMGYVEMKHGAFGLHRKQGYYRPFKDWLEDYEYEVLGNIHDNPELLRTPQNDEVRE